MTQSESTSSEVESEMESRWRWLWDRSGRISGIVLGFLTCVFLLILAIAGFTPAIGLLVIVFSGVVMIAVGGRIHAS